MIGVAPSAHAAFDLHIAVADAGDATALSIAVVAQLIGDDLAKLRGQGDRIKSPMISIGWSWVWHGV